MATMMTFERRCTRISGAAPLTGTPTAAHGTACLRFRGTQHPDTTYVMQHQDDQYSTLVRGTGWWLYVSTPVGLACFTALNDLLAKAPTAALVTVLERLEYLRPTAWIAFDAATEATWFGRSLDGFCSLFFGGNDDHLVIADSRTAVAERLGPVRFSRTDETEWCKRSVLSPEGSFYEGVKRCFAGARYTVTAGEATPRLERLLAPHADGPPYSDPVALLTSNLRALFAGYSNRRLALRLSGGVDSRTLLVGLLDAVREGILQRDQILCTSVLFPGFDCDESDIIRRVVELAGVEWVGIEATQQNVQRAQARCLDLPAPPFPTAFIGALCLGAAKQHGAEIMLTGHGGDEVLDFNLTDVLGLPLGERLRRLDLIRWLRQTHGWPSEAKALAVTLLGRRGQRSLLRQIRSYGLPTDTLHTLRLGTRLAIAEGTGYEMVAAAANRCGLLLDVLFYRGPFMLQLDPVGAATRRGHPYKDAARRYMAKHAPAVAEVPTRKVAFDAMTASLLRPTSINSDPVDNAQAATYSSEQSFVAWRTRHQRGLG